MAIAYETHVESHIAKRIQDEIERNGGHFIELRKVGYQQTDRSYEVAFRNPAGQKITASCKVDWRTKRIYWEIPITNLLMQTQGAASNILEELKSPFRFARLAAVRELATHKQISDEVRAKLAQMAVDDEDPQVRDEAKTIVRGF
ncbi:MAG: hypothetical protein OT477_17600 [Chloroflexi bacterium]|nr:hypothetical protein [Chloroflexota bacterium]